MSNQGKEEIYKGRVGCEIPLTTLDSRNIDIYSVHDQPSHSFYLRIIIPIATSSSSPTHAPTHKLSLASEPKDNFGSTQPFFSKQANTKSYPSNSYPILSLRTNSLPKRSVPNEFQALTSASLEPGAEDDGGVETKRVMERREGWKMLTTLRISVCKSGLLARAPEEGDEEEEDEENGRGTLHSNEAYDHPSSGVT